MIYSTLYNNLIKAFVENNTINNKIKIAKPNEIVYVTGILSNRFFLFEKAIVKKIRGDEESMVLGLDFENDALGHTLDGLTEVGHGLFIDLRKREIMIHTRNMEEFYSSHKIKED